MATDSNARVIQGNNSRGAQKRINQALEPKPGYVVAEVSTKSDGVRRYIEKDGSTFSAALIRIGSLLRMTSNDKPNREKIEVWLREMLSSVNTEIEQNQSVLNEKARDAGKLPTISGGGTAVSTVYVNHPHMLRIVESLSLIDELALLGEQLWYRGVFDDDQYNQSKKQLLRPITHVVDRFYVVTNIGKRAGGQYNPSDFLSILKEEESIADMLLKHTKIGQVVPVEAPPTPELDVQSA